VLARDLAEPYPHITTDEDPALADGLPPGSPRTAGPLVAAERVPALDLALALALAPPKTTVGRRRASTHPRPAPCQRRGAA
jgi:hypothetical protein